MIKLEEIGKLNIQIADGNYSAKYPRNDEFVNEGVPFIRANNFKNHEIVDDALLFITKEKHAILKKGHLKPGDVLITTRGNIGNTAIVPERHNDSNINAQIVLLRPDSTINNKYLMLLFQSPDVIRQIEGLTTGTALKQLPVGQLKKVKIPIPPIADQIRIAEVLSHAEALIAQRKQSISLLDELLKSTFLEMFGDPVKNEKEWTLDSLSSFGTLKNGLNYSRDESGQEIKSLGVGDFKSLWRITDTNKLPMISLSAYPSKEYFLQDEDLIFVRSNGNKELIGRCIVIYTNGEKVTFSGFCIRYRTFSNQINTTFLAHLFRIHSFKQKMLQNGRGANIQNINQQLLENLKIPVPPIELQNKFAAVVEKVEALKAQYQQSLTELQNMYGVLSQKAFKGELSLVETKIKEKVL